MAEKQRCRCGGESGAQEAFLARMTAQCRAIEQYQIHAVQDQGRDLSLEEAAREWIARYADSFAENYEAH